MRPHTESSKRRTNTRSLTSVIVALLGLGLTVPTAARAQTWGQYGVSILPMPVGSYTFQAGNLVNDAGQVAGAINVGGVYQAFLWSPGSTSVTDLGTSGGTYALGQGTNASGEVTGYFKDLSGNNQAFLYDGTAMRSLSTLGGAQSEGFGINASGEVTGNSEVSGNNAFHAFLYNNGVMNDLGTLGGTNSYGIGVNASGEVTGSSEVSGNGGTHAFVYNNGMMKDLGTLGGASYGVGINASGEVTGYFKDLSGNSHAFLYNGTTMNDLGTLGATSSGAWGVSDAGDAVGYASGFSSGPSQRAALWEGGTGYFLDAIVGGGWTFADALGISPGGTIMALGGNSKFSGVAIVALKPNAAPSTVTPEPAPILLLATGLIGLAGVSIRKEGAGTA